MNVGLLHDRRDGLLGHPPRLEKAREVRALTPPGDAKLNRAGACLPVAVAIAVALSKGIGRTFARRRSRAASISSSIRPKQSYPGTPRFLDSTQFAQGRSSDAVRASAIAIVVAIFAFSRGRRIVPSEGLRRQQTTSDPEIIVGTGRHGNACRGPVGRLISGPMEVMRWLRLVLN